MTPAVGNVTDLLGLGTGGANLKSCLALNPTYHIQTQEKETLFSVSRVYFEMI